MKKFFLTLFSILIIVSLSPKVTHALTDITLQDNTKEQTISVIFDSHNEKLVGTSIYIIFSGDITIEEVSKGDYCSLLFDSYISANKVSIECFNSDEISMNKEIANIKYLAKDNNYSFKIDESTLDIGSAKLGNIENVNNKEYISITEVDPTPPEPSVYVYIYDIILLLTIFGLIVTAIFLIIRKLVHPKGKNKKTNQEHS